MTALVAAISGVYGLVIGSFLNVVIWRVPRKESLVKPPSHCPACDVKIANRDNIPVVSWLLLRGRCRNCGNPISARYPFIELLTGVLFAAVGARFAHSAWALPAYLVLTASLIALSAIDLEHYLLPNRILYPTDARGGRAARGRVGGGERLGRVRARGASRARSRSSSSSSSTSCRRAAWASATSASRSCSGSASGWLGWGEVAGGLFAGFLYGAVVGVVLILVKVRGRKQQIPFGPFLAAGAMTFVLFGEPIVDWYRHLGR